MTETKIDQNEPIEANFKTIDNRPDYDILPATTEPTAMKIIEMAVNRNLDTEKLRELIALSQKVRAEGAREAYHKAMAAFKRDMPPLPKDKKNNAFNGAPYTSFGLMLQVCNPVLGNHGLSLSHKPIPTEDPKTLSIEAVLSHALGHSVSYPMTMPVVEPPVGKSSGRAAMNAQQAIRATFTYLRSAVTEGILGIAGTEASSYDNDGNSPGGGFITEGQAKILTKLVKEKYGEKAGAFFAELNEFIGVETIEEIPANKFGFVKAGLDKIKTKGG